VAGSFFGADGVDVSVGVGDSVIEFIGVTVVVTSNLGRGVSNCVGVDVGVLDAPIVGVAVGLPACDVEVAVTVRVPVAAAVCVGEMVGDGVAVCA
jgi:hypothetical protein